MQNCAIDYYPATFATSGPALIGINAANEGLLDGFLHHPTVDMLVCRVRNEEELRDFRDRLERLGLLGWRHVWMRNGDIVDLAKLGALLHPAPWLRPADLGAALRVLRSLQPVRHHPHDGDRAGDGPHRQLGGGTGPAGMR